MEFYEAIRRRCSVREYEDRPVEDDKLRRVLDAGRLSPSARNRQERIFVVVRDAGTRMKLMSAAKNQPFVGQAPVIIACCAQTDKHVMTCGEMCYSIDVAIAVDHMTLAAWELGLGTCWIGAFYADQVRQILDIPEDVPVVELLALGYPERVPAQTDRLPMEQIVHWDRW